MSHDDSAAPATSETLLSTTWSCEELPSFILLETGGYLLMETGGNLYKETELV